MKPLSILGAFVLLVIVLLMIGGFTGRFGFNSLYTHCGIRYADFGGTRYYADPPLDDGSADPPAGWGNPSDGGFIVVTDAGHAMYFGLFHAAAFSTHPKSGIPTIQVCS